MISSKEDLEKFIEDIGQKMSEAAELCEKAGIPSQASIFYTIAGSYYHSLEAVNTLKDTMHVHATMLIEELKHTYKGA
jgi:hypothetical protein